MTVEFFIAKRLFHYRKNKKQISRPAVKIAMWGTAVGLIVMIVSLCIVIGFKHEIRAKVIGFGAHIQIQQFNANQSFDILPMEVSADLQKQLSALSGVAKVQRFSTKVGVINRQKEFKGFLLKGVGSEYGLDFFKHYLVEGEIPMFSDTAASKKVLISRLMADKLKLKIGDKIYAYFIQNNVRARPLVVSGIYQTNFTEFDNYIALTDIYTVNKLNDWKRDEAAGIELIIDDYDHLDETAAEVNGVMAQQINRYDGDYYTQTVEQLNPSLFTWLNVLDTNVWVILVLILGVAGFTMISGLLILILERTNMIGILKAMGTQNRSIRKIFLYYSIFIIGRGMLWGNFAALLLCLLQQHFGWVKLDPAMYYLNAVPIEFDWWLIVLLNVGMFIVSVMMLVAPSALISRISPTKAIRFE